MIRRLLVVCFVFIAGAVYLAFAPKSESVPIRLSLTDFPNQIGTWRASFNDEMDQRVLDVLGVDDYISRTYFEPRMGPVGLYIGYYQSQREGDTMHSPMNCMPGAGWNAVKRDFISVGIPLEASSYEADPEEIPRHGEIRINRLVIQKGLEKQVVLYWYQSHGRVVASEYWGKIYTVLDAIRTNRTDAAMVRVIAPVRGMDDSAEVLAANCATEFVKMMFPLLDQYLPE